MSSSLPGNATLAYTGLGEKNPPNIITTERDPRTSDWRNVKIGDFWYNKTTRKFWILVSNAQNTAVWDPFAGPTAGDISTLTGDTGGAVAGDTNGNVNILGTSGQITVTGNSATNTLTLALAGGGTAIDSFKPDSGTDPVVPNGSGQVTMAGSGSITTVGGANTLTTQLTGLTAHNVLVGAGTTTITKVAPSATVGAPFISAGAAVDPTFSTTFSIADSAVTAQSSGSASGTTSGFIAINTDTAAQSSAGLQISAATSANANVNPIVAFGINSVAQWTIGCQQNDSNAFKLSQASTLGTNDVIAATTTGAVTKPLQPAFLAQLTVSTAGGVTGNGAGFTLSSASGATLTSVFDQGSNFNAATGTFTAPVTGKYFFESRISVSDLDATMTGASIGIVAGARNFQGGVVNIGAIRDINNQCGMLSVSGFADLTATQTAVTTVAISGAAGNTANVIGGATLLSYFQGFLVC